MIDFKKSIVQPIQSASLDARGIELFVKRDDLLHPDISGNKWRKLRFNVIQCFKNHNAGILTFGGAYSNHLLATAAACAEVGLKSIGIVRGDEHTFESNAILKRCTSYGMELQFVSRELYQLRNDRYYQENLLIQNSNYYVVPEGGANYLGMIGCQELVSQIEQPFDVIVSAQGTSTTSCGLALGLDDSQRLMVVPVLKGYDSIGEMQSLMSRSAMAEDAIDFALSSVLVSDEYHFGGYGKYTWELLEFIRSFHNRYRIKLDPIYTGKAMYALQKEIDSGAMDGKRIVFLHTGGVQGAQSIIEKSGFDLFGG